MNPLPRLQLRALVPGFQTPELLHPECGFSMQSRAFRYAAALVDRSRQCPETSECRRGEDVAVVALDQSYWVLPRSSYECAKALGVPVDDAVWVAQ